MRHFSPGDQVLVRVIDPGGKLGDRWDGPYEVERKIAYRLAVLHRRKKCMIAHINRLKPWNAPDASVLRVVVADEEVVTAEKVEPDWRTLLEPQQRKDQMDGSFGECIGLRVNSWGLEGRFGGRFTGICKNPLLRSILVKCLAHQSVYQF